MKENGLTVKKKVKKQTISSRNYHMDADYTADLVLLIKTPAQTEFLLHSLKQAARGIGLLVNSDKTLLICFNQRGTITTSHDQPLKLVHHLNTSVVISHLLKVMSTYAQERAWPALNVIDSMEIESLG